MVSTLAVLSIAVAAVTAAGGGTPAIMDARKKLYETAYTWTDQRQTVRVTVIDPNGREQVRIVESFERRYATAERRALLVFREPDSVKGMAVLSHVRADRGREQWLYLPRLKRARRFASTRSDEGVLGTDLTTGELDLMNEMLAWGTADAQVQVVAEDVIDGVPTHRLNVIPRVEREGVGRLVMWLGTRDLVVRRLEIYGREGTLTKRVSQAEIHFVGSVPIPSRIEVDDPATHSRSIFEVQDVHVDVGLPDDLFSLASIERMAN